MTPQNGQISQTRDPKVWGKPQNQGGKPQNSGENPKIWGPQMSTLKKPEETPKMRPKNGDTPQARPPKTGSPQTQPPQTPPLGPLGGFWGAPMGFLGFPGFGVPPEPPLVQFSASSTTILDEEPIVNRGLAAALLLCQNKGLLETTVQKVARVKAPNKSLPSAVYCIEDKMAIDDKYSRREEFRGFTQDFKEKDGYRPDVKIEYVDETGRKLTPKEAFRQLSHRFHGKGSGKMKTERRMKKLDEEALLKKMSSSDTPLGTVALLQEKQRAQKTPYIVLSGSGKSMNANTITK